MFNNRLVVSTDHVKAKFGDITVLSSDGSDSVPSEDRFLASIKVPFKVLPVIKL